MKSKFGISLMVIGAVLVIAALSLAVYNIYTDRAAGQRAREALDALEIAITENSIKAAEQTPTTGTFVIGDDGTLQDYISDPKHTSSIAQDTAEPVSIGGYNYIGVISMPDIGITLPVMEEWDYDRLRIAPCRYSGSVATDDLIIAAHNYNSHFGRIKNLDSGSYVSFTDTLGIRHDYTVDHIESIHGNDGGEVFSGDWAITLFTCNFDGSERITVRCRRAVPDDDA